MDNSKTVKEQQPLKLSPSEPAYCKLNELATLLAWARNPHMLHAVSHDLPEPECQAMIADLEETMNQWIQAGAFASVLFHLLPDKDHGI